MAYVKKKYRQRTAKSNRQRMFYSVIEGMTPIYETDDDGNPIIEKVLEDGTIIYVKTGKEEPYYSEPVEFEAPISSKLNEEHAKEFGVDKSSIYSEMVCEKGKVNIGYGARIWRTSEIGRKDNGKVDESSADYIVKGVLDEYLRFDFYLLFKNNSDS